MKATFRRLVTGYVHETQILEVTFSRKEDGKNGSNEKWLLIDKYANSSQSEYDFFIFKDNSDNLIEHANVNGYSWDLAFSSYVEEHFPFKHFSWSNYGNGEPWGTGILSGEHVPALIYPVLRKIFFKIWDQSPLTYTYQLPQSTEQSRVVTQSTEQSRVMTQSAEQSSVVDGSLTISSDVDRDLKNVIITDNLFVKNGMKKRYKESFSDAKEPSKRCDRFYKYVTKTADQ